MINKADFEARIRKFVATGSGIDSKWVIPGNDNAPSPRAPFASVLLITDNADGLPAIREADEGDDDVRLHNTRDRRATYSVQFYRKGAHENASKFVAWAVSDVGNLAAEEFGFRAQRVGDVRQLDDVVSDDFEERCGLDLTLDYQRVDEYVVRAIESVPFSVNRNDQEVERAAGE